MIEKSYTPANLAKETHKNRQQQTMHHSCMHQFKYTRDIPKAKVKIVVPPWHSQNSTLRLGAYSGLYAHDLTRNLCPHPLGHTTRD